MGSNFPKKAVPVKKVQAKGPKKRLVEPAVKSRGWMISGWDLSMSSIAGAAIAYDATLKKLKGPVFVSKRWRKEDHYFNRLNDAARAYDLVLDLQHQLGISLAVDEVWVAEEEPWPLTGGFSKKGNSGFLKQQAEISGAFLGGLLRYGFNQIWQLRSDQWRKTVADDLGISIHFKYWRSEDLSAQHNCRWEDSGKFRARQWALNGRGFPNEVPDWPDIISSNHGQIPRPEGSKARAVQSDDRYESLAICWTLYRDLQEQDVFKNISAEA